MNPTTNSNGQGLESTRNNADETHNKKSNSEIIKREEAGPFTIVTVGDRSFVGIGQYRLTEPTTKEECKEWVKEITWDKILTVIHVCVEAERSFAALPPEQQEYLKDQYLKKENINEIKGL